MISALDRKLLRDLSQMKGQSIAIAIVIAAGVATFVNSRTILNSLELTRSTFYERYRFADVFAKVKRAPDVVADGLSEIPGVAQVETRIVELVTLDVPGLEDPAVGQLISLPVTRSPRLNQIYLRRGRQLEIGHDDEVLASEAFMKANKLDLDSSIVAIINGRKKELRIVGVAFSPEYVFQIKPGDMLPDPKHFGILWMEHEALSTAYDMKGAFNDVAIGLTMGTPVEEVLQSGAPVVGVEPIFLVDADPRQLLPPLRQLVALSRVLLFRLKQVEPRGEPLFTGPGLVLGHHRSDLLPGVSVASLDATGWPYIMVLVNARPTQRQE